VLAIEMVLLKDLHEIFSPTLVANMDRHTLNFVASESDEEQKDRKKITARLAKLMEAKQVCDDYQYMASGGK
jgi:hypothetical protein